jgi:hypothetical protein
MKKEIKHILKLIKVQRKNGVRYHRFNVNDLKTATDIVNRLEYDYSFRLTITDNDKYILEIFNTITVK